jgi:2-oxoglutarate ferredoxin oxidoreductase subunit alpha
MAKSLVGLVRLRTIWPFPNKELSRLLKGAERVVVPELNQGQLISEVERALPGKEVVGVNRFDGELLTPEEILQAL